MQQWHSMEAEAVLTHLGSSPHDGIAEDEAKRRLAEYGYNELKEEKRVLPLTIFINQFKNVLIIIFSLLLCCQHLSEKSSTQPSLW
jgi:P-type Ca2+ transporter type 2C